MVIKKHKSKILVHVLYDRTLLWIALCQICIGFMMIASASFPIGERLYDDSFYFVKRNIFYLSLAFFLAPIILRIPMLVWQNYSTVILLIVIFLLLVVLVFGKSFNGALRWISFGSLNIQPAELSKLALFFYLSNYLSRKEKEVRNNFWGFCKPICVMSLIASLLLVQPDLGTVLVLFFTTLSMLFLSGAKIFSFLSIIGLGCFLIIMLIIKKSYRIRRIISFIDPWRDPFGSGYQLTQSLMAFGRGEFCGKGLGNSIHKLEYLPEAHTDFIFSIIGEELGYFGVIFTLIMVFLITCKAILISNKAFLINQNFSGFLSCSIGIWFGFQSLVNIGTASGMLPTKGLTLPFISYGGSSLLTMTTAIMLLLRIDFETRIKKLQAISKENL